MSEIKQRLYIGIRQIGKKFQSCLMDTKSKEIIYTSTEFDSREDAIEDARWEITLRYAAKGYNIQLVGKK